MSRYSFEGVLQAVYGADLYGVDRKDLHCDKELDTADMMQCMQFQDPKNILKQLDVSDAKFYIDFIVLCAILAVLRICCYLVLRMRVKMH